MTSPPQLFAGRGNQALADAVAARLGLPVGKRTIERFPDGELHVEITESVRGADVYLLQPTSTPAEAHLMELLLLTDACRRAGAARITAVVPYFGYARQDRRSTGRDAVGGRLVADLLQAGGVQRVVTIDAHTAALEAFFATGFEHLTAVPDLADAIRPAVTAASVIVSPDLGATKLAQRYARVLSLPVALVHKERLSGVSVRAHSISGDVRGRIPIVVDDMISTGATVTAAVEAAVGAGAVAGVTVVATHAVFTGPALERLAAPHIKRCIVTDSVALPGETWPSTSAASTQGTSAHGTSAHSWLTRVSVAPLLASAIVRLHEGRSLADLIAHGT